jgi:hypothetical protein
VIETADQFGKRICLKASQRGSGAHGRESRHREGAEWIWNLADLHFPGAIQIVELYHPCQYLSDLARRSPQELHQTDGVDEQAQAATGRGKN